MAQRLNIHNSKRRKRMKTFGKSALAVVLLIVAIATTAHAQQYPKATGYVNDFANLLTREQVRSEEHTSELQSQFHLVCRLLLEIIISRHPQTGFRRGGDRHDARPFLSPPA